MQYDAFGQQDFVPTHSWTWILHQACMFGLKLLIKTWVFNFNIKSYCSQWFSCLKYLFLLWKWIFMMVWKNNENSYKWCKLWISPMLWCPYFRNHWLKKKCEKCKNHIEYVRHVTFFWQIFVIVWKNQNSDNFKVQPSSQL